jgi:hypothetical protein
MLRRLRGRTEPFAGGPAAKLINLAPRTVRSGALGLPPSRDKASPPRAACRNHTVVTACIHRSRRVTSRYLRDQPDPSLEARLPRRVALADDRFDHGTCGAPGDRVGDEGLVRRDLPVAESRGWRSAGTDRRDASAASAQCCGAASRGGDPRMTSLRIRVRCPRGAMRR